MSRSSGLVLCLGAVVVEINDLVLFIGKHRSQESSCIRNRCHVWRASMEASAIGPFAANARVFRQAVYHTGPGILSLPEEA
jgi:hypothetical protein